LGWHFWGPAAADEKVQDLSDYVLTPCAKKIVRIRALPAALNGGKPTANGPVRRHHDRA
jgi:hypothetical protein